MVQLLCKSLWEVFEMQIYTLLKALRLRPRMYLDSHSITKLRTFLDGYHCALYNFNVKENPQKTILPLPFYFFHKYTAYRFGYGESTIGWHNIILDQTNRDEEKAFNLFFDLLDDFKELKISKCFVADLNKDNVKYHVTDKHAPKRTFGKDFEFREPAYRSPLRISYIEVSDEYCKLYIGIVHTHVGAISWTMEEINYKNEKKVRAYFKSCFGDIDWHEENPKNILNIESLFSSEAVIID